MFSGVRSEDVNPELRPALGVRLENLRIYNAHSIIKQPIQILHRNLVRNRDAQGGHEMRFRKPMRGFRKMQVRTITIIIRRIWPGGMPMPMESQQLYRNIIRALVLQKVEMEIP